MREQRLWILCLSLGCTASSTGGQDECRDVVASETGLTDVEPTTSEPTTTTTSAPTSTGEPTGTKLEPPLSRVTGMVELEYLEDMNGLIQHQFMLGPGRFLVYDSYFDTYEVVIPRRGIDTCEVRIVDYDTSHQTNRVAGDVTLSVDGSPIAVSAQAGTAGEYDGARVDELLPDPWGRAIGFSAPGDTYPGFDLQPAVIFPAGLIELTSPEPGADEVMPRDALELRWTGLGSDPLWLKVSTEELHAYCLLEDDGEFRVPSEVFDWVVTWPAPTTLYLRREDRRYYEVAPDDWLMAFANVEVRVDVTLE